MKTKLIILMSLLASAPLLHAEIYKHVDKEGRITYSNKPIPGAKKLFLDAPTQKHGIKNATPQDFPKVDSRVQKTRDDLRRSILQEELAAEEKLLAEARKSPAQDDDDMHERNIAALKKELSSLSLGRM